MYKIQGTCHFPAPFGARPMPQTPPELLLVPFQEVRHYEPDDCLHCETVAVRGAALDWKIPVHRHEGLFQFMYLEAGHVSGSVDARPLEAQAPLALVLAPGTVHGFEYTPDAVGHQVTVPSATLHRQLGGSGFVDATLGASFVLSGAQLGDPLVCENLFAQLANEFRGQSPGRVHALLAQVTLLAIHLLRRRGAVFEAQTWPGARDTLVQRYLSLVDAHFRQHQALAFYADALQVTPDHLSRACRHHSKRSALQVLHDRVMLEARRLLAYTPMPVAEVAGVLGFNDPAYFSKFFARSQGDTPSQYRVLVAAGVREAVARPTLGSS